MTGVAKLPVKCERLAVLDESTMAACGRQGVYFRTMAATAPSSVSSWAANVSLPGRAEHCAPWHPPGTPLRQCGVFYNKAGRVHFGRCGAAPESRSLLQLPPISGRVEEMRVFFGRVLVVRTADEIIFYALELAHGEETPRLSLIGRATLPLHAAAKDTATTLLMDGFSCPAADAAMNDVDNALLSVVVYSRSTQHVGALLLAVGSTRVTVQRQSRDGGLALPHGGDASLQCWSLDWSRREVLFVFSNSANTTTTATSTMSLDTMEWTATCIDVTQLPSVTFTDVRHTHTGELWAIDKSCDGVVKLLRLSAGCVTREVKLPHAAGDDTFLTTWGSTLFVLTGRTVVEVRADDGRDGTSAATTLCDWLIQRTASEPCDDGRQRRQRKQQGNSIQKEIDKVVAFVKNTACSSFTTIVRDCRYVSCAPDAVGAYRHAILDAIHSDDDEHCSGEHLVRYVAVAQSLHPVTILRVLNVRDPSVRLSIAVLLAAKPPLASGGVRLLEWDPAVRDFAAAAGTTGAKRAIAALCESALAALAAGALGAVGLLCAVADVLMVAAFGGDKRAVVSCGEEAAEAAIAEAVGVLSSYAQWALAAAPALGTMTAHVGPERSGRKEAAVRDRVAHAIATSRNVQIEPLPHLGRR